MRSYVGSALLVLLVVTAGCIAPVDGPALTDDGGSDGPAPPDPAADTLGWEAGYWHNESLSITRSDGLNGTERAAVVARAMARVEHIRSLEFKTTVPVTVISRAEYREQYAGGGSDHSEAFEQFDNAKFEAMLLVGEREESLATQTTNRGSSVLGFYSPSNDSIVLVSEEDAGQPTIDGELTLGHELVHALQDQHFDLSSIRRPTRDAYNAGNGLIEGDAHYVERRYGERCGTTWSCLSPPSSSGGSSGSSNGSRLHYGVYFLNFFPYSDGPSFVAHYQREAGWKGVDAMYGAPPQSAEQVIHPQKYRSDPPTNVALADRNSGTWERVRPRERRDYATLGQSALSSMFAYTFTDDYNQSAVVRPEQFINYEEGGSVNGSDPFDYALDYTDGWDGDRLHVYHDGTGELAYVWKIDWDSPEEAREFATGYRRLLSHWDGRRVSEEVWVVEKGPFADAFRISVSGDTVTITNAPTRADLTSVR